MTRNGLPIAAHLAFLVALAAAAAFVAALAVIVWLPPRPPDVLRSDQVSAAFASGYAEAIRSGRPPRGGDMRWRILGERPNATGRLTPRIARDIAARLRLPMDAVQVAASIQRQDVFVFRVQTSERLIVTSPPPGEGERATLVLPQEPPQEVIERALELAARQGVRVPPPPSPPDPPLFAPAPPGVLLVSGVEVAARLPNGRWLAMAQGRNWAELGWIARAALGVFVTVLVMTGLALLVARRLAQPIQSFAGAVQAVGVDPLREPVRESGPRELRDAARAVNAMQTRLRALIADRTRTLAAVAHDMRTPLMRLRLAAENAEPALRERMAKEIGDVEALVASFIAFAREDPAEEPRVRLDLAALLESLADDQAAAGRDVRYEGPERLVVTGQRLGLKRLFANLIDNAVKYGERARLSLSVQGARAVVVVEDDGPGVPPEQRERVFQPFVRLAEGQSGAGLGLAAARTIARAHGGEVELVDSQKGARLRVSLPM